MNNFPTTFYEYASAASVPLTMMAIKYAWGLSRQFLVLQTLFNVKKLEVDLLKTDQKKMEIQIALHDADIAHMRGDLASISMKLESLPRIATILESIAPEMKTFVPRQEIEVRFKAIETVITSLQ